MGEVMRRAEAGPEAAAPPERPAVCKYTCAELCRGVAAAPLCYADEM